MKTIIERGASWSMEETKLLLLLWGQDIVQRQATNTKRTKEVYERIAERFSQNGHTRTPDQVRTRVFNMIAEYRRILKDIHINPERAKKCVFFEPLHKIYQAKHMEDIKNALDDYEPDNPYSPVLVTDSESDNEATTDGNETISNLTNDTTKILASPNQAQSLSTQTMNSYINSTTNNTVLLENNGDASANNSTEKDSSPSNSSNSHSGEGATSKKIKLESLKSGQNQSNVPSTSSTSTNSSTSTDYQNATSKQNKSSSTQHSSTTGAGATTSGAAVNVASAAASSSASSSQRHQSLLLPHATSSGASTPISKLTTTGSNSTPSYININSTKLPIIRTNQLIGHSNGNESINLNGTTTRLPTTAAITSHQLYQAPVNTFDVTSSALLIDRMFAHLSRESENMREWIALEKERLALERTRRQQETEREVRRERVLIDTLMRFQEQWLSFLSRLDSRLVEGFNEPPPELLIPKEATQSSSADQTQLSQTSQANQNPCSASTVTNSNQSAEASKP